MFYRHLTCLLLYWVLSTQYSVLASVAAQEIQWRTNYNVARKEALSKDRPLVLDFGTEQCFWCKKLDATTFRDARVVETINVNFIPLKIDANADARLAEILGIQAFPTLVLAAPDGRILEILEGYKESGPLHEYLQRILASLKNPEWMTRDYQEAVKAIAAADYARAISLLKSITVDGKDLPVQTKAKQVLGDLEEQAAGRLAHAKQLEEKGESSQAIALLSKLSRDFSGTQAAAQSGQFLATLAARPKAPSQERIRQGRELLAQAREDYRTEQYLCCLDRCERLATSFADLPEGQQGMELAARIKNNPERLQQTCDRLRDHFSELYLALADTSMNNNQPRQAAEYLERVLQSFPGTPRAEKARLRLNQLQGGAEIQVP
jgi:thioredoxin-like negative regulator of GroEL